MLSEKFSALQQHPSCSISRTMDKLNKSDKQAFTDALKNPEIGIRVIYRIMKEEGYTLSRESIAKARLCARETSSCKCAAFGENK